jgi:acyl CoA:acetate/3-ketoacid CoA transferase alpha subunit
MKEAVQGYVKSGDVLFISGAQHGAPSAAIAEIIRQKIDHLTLITCLTNTNTMIGEGLIDRLITGYSQLDEKRTYVQSREHQVDRMSIHPHPGRRRQSRYPGHRHPARATL